MTQWSLSGTYFETCNCEVACPCVFTSPPTQGDCTALVAWHIKEGKFDNLVLDGLDVALLVYAPSTMVESKWKVAAYLDDKANEAQKNALLAIYSGQAGGHPAMLASFIGEILGVKSVPMQYRGDGKNRSLEIPGIIDAEIKALEGQNGNPVTIDNHILCIAPGEPVTVARSNHFRLADYGYDWKLSGRNGFLSDFTYSGA